MKRSFLDDGTFNTIDHDLLPGVFATGNKPCHNSCQNNDGKDDHISVRYFFNHTPVVFIVLKDNPNFKTLYF